MIDIKVLRDIVPDYIRLAAEEKTLCRLEGIHGRPHWDRVATMGAMLATVTPGANLKVILHFAYLHDSCRMHDGGDADHGARAAAWLNSFDLFLDDQEHGLLVYAVKNHSGGQLSTDPTIGCCWDADRIDLTRLGIDPNPEYLSTTAGKDVANMIGRQRA